MLTAGGLAVEPTGNWLPDTYIGLMARLPQSWIQLEKSSRDLDMTMQIIWPLLSAATLLIASSPTRSAAHASLSIHAMALSQARSLTTHGATLLMTRRPVSSRLVLQVDCVILIPA